MKDTHLIIALYRALDRYGTTALPHDDADRTERGRGGPWHEDRRRSPGWVSISEIEASQSPNTYPRLTKRAIRARCEALSREDASPVRDVEKRPGRLRTWVLVAPPGDRAEAADDGAATDAPATTAAAGGDAPSDGRAEASRDAREREGAPDGAREDEDGAGGGLEEVGRDDAGDEEESRARSAPVR